MIFNIQTDDFHIAVKRNIDLFRHSYFHALTDICRNAAKLACFVFRHNVGNQPVADLGIIISVPVIGIVDPQSRQLSFLLTIHKVNTSRIPHRVPCRIVYRRRLVYDLTHSGIKELIKCPSTGFIPVADGIAYIGCFMLGQRQSLVGVKLYR